MEGCRTHSNHPKCFAFRKIWLHVAIQLGFRVPHHIMYVKLLAGWSQGVYCRFDDLSQTFKLIQRKPKNWRAQPKPHYDLFCMPINVRHFRDLAPSLPRVILIDTNRIYPQISLWWMSQHPQRSSQGICDLDHNAVEKNRLSHCRITPSIRKALYSGFSSKFRCNSIHFIDSEMEVSCQCPTKGGARWMRRISFTTSGSYL